jgi:thiol-disulfide isomerase/thioredoxin/dienelactone hydrolase
MFMNHLLRVIVAGALLTMATTGVASDTRELHLPGRTDVSIRIEPAMGDTLLLWLPSGIPVATHDADIARRVAKLGIEVWRPDVIEAHFLPNLESSLAQVPDSDITALIDAARATGKRVVLLAAAHAAALALRGAHAWQTLHPGDQELLGAVLLHPYLYLGPPEPGRDAEFHPVVRSTSLPVVIVQPGNSPTRFRVDALRAALEQGGARVQVQLLPGVRDRYYFRADATPAEDAEAAHLPERLKGAIATMLAENGTADMRPVKEPAPSGAPATAAQPDNRGLQPYVGDPSAPTLVLAGLDGRTYDLARYRGHVVLVNFWASWCPPCVREMPSMQRLEKKLRGKPFAILAVNTAESPQDVRAFLGRHRIHLPVMIDADGSTVKRWKVFVFPTSFVIDTEGRIRLGVYGEVAWDAPDTVGKISALLPTVR